jgi:hypothetical protein
VGKVRFHAGDRVAINYPSFGRRSLGVLVMPDGSREIRPAGKPLTIAPGTRGRIVFLTLYGDGALVLWFSPHGYLYGIQPLAGLYLAD